MGLRSSDLDRDFDARLSEIERQLREVRRAMKAVARGRAVDLSAIRTAAGTSAAAVRSREPLESTAAGGTIGERTSVGSRAGQPRVDAGSTLPGAAGESPTTSVRAPRVEKERFAHYFSGHWFRGPPVSEERRVQRNRAIVMMIVVAVAAYMLYYFASK